METEDASVINSLMSCVAVNQYALRTELPLCHTSLLINEPPLADPRFSISLGVIDGECITDAIDPASDSMSSNG
jgi:hypothetical protein